MKMQEVFNENILQTKIEIHIKWWHYEEEV